MSGTMRSGLNRLVCFVRGHRYRAFGKLWSAELVHRYRGIWNGATACHRCGAALDAAGAEEEKTDG